MSAFSRETREPLTEARQMELHLQDLPNQPAEIPVPGTACTLRVGVKRETLELVISLKRTA